MANLNQMHVIYLIGFSPKFGYLPGNTSLDRAAKTWINDKGDKVGIWSEDWGNQLGSKIKKYYPDITYEVWRPDIRADKVYTHVFNNGVINKSFPIKKSLFFSGLRPIYDQYSQMMEHELSNYCNENKKIIILMPAVRKKITVNIQKKFGNSIQIINTHFLNCKSLVCKKENTINIFRNIHNYVKFQQQSFFLKQITDLVVAHKKYIPNLNKVINGKVYFNTFGTDLSFWKKNDSKQSARQKLNLSKRKKIILLSSRLIPDYQIISVLKMISKLKKYNCYFIFTSQGPNSYMQLIEQAIKKYGLMDYVCFTGYVTEKKLRDLYVASDYFFMSSKFNAGPMSSFIGILMGKPIITTDSGLAAEMLSDNNAGLLLPPSNYKVWEKKFSELLNEDIEINRLDKQIVIDTFDWKNIVDKWLDILSAQLDNYKISES